MPDILKTWPGFMERWKVEKLFAQKFVHFYFSVGRGMPKQYVYRIWFTHQGEILGCFDVDCIVKNDGSLPKLRSLSNRLSEWQFKPDIYVAICTPPFDRVEGEKVFHAGFRGWRYFDFDTYKQSLEAKVCI